MSLDDLYNHLKVYESEVQKKSESNSQNMAFISSAKHSSGNEEVNTASVSTASTNVSPASANIGAASISQDTACAYIASQSCDSQIKFEDINHIDEDDMEEMDIKWNMALLSMRADNFMANEQEDHALVADEEAPTEFALMAKTSADSEDLSWTSIPEFADDTVADYSRPSTTIESTSDDAQNRNPSVPEIEALPSTISSKSFIKFVKASNPLTVAKLDKKESVRKPSIKYAELYRKPTKRAVPRTTLMTKAIETVAALGKQHKASCKTKLVKSVTKPLHTLHMDLFRPTSVSSLNHKWYCLVVTNDFSRCDNRGEFRNKEMNDFCLKKGIKREFSNARTLQQNGVAERRNRTLIEAARTMLVDAKLPITFWAEAVNTACYVQNRVLVNKSQNKTPYELFNDSCGADAPESRGNSNPTATSTNPLADHMETLAVETPIPTASSLVPTACLNDSPEPSSNTRLISKKVTSQDDTPSLDNILSLINRFEDILGVTTNTDDTNGVEADLGNMETTITASPTPTLRIHKDHPKSQIIGPVDTPIQTRNKAKEIEEQSFIATIHQKTYLALFQFCLFSCFLSQEEPKKISDALQDPSCVEAMQED
nr:hypothetical protein [Tanacetum cinerariifolium]